MESYKHSGAVPPVGALITLLAGCVTAAILGVVYSYAIVYIPFIYVNILVTVGFGLALGFAVGWAGKAGKIRNNVALGCLGLLSGVVGLYVAWASDAKARLDDGVWAFNPSLLQDYIGFFYDQGMWSVFGDEPVSGVMLAVVWLIEAVIIVGGAGVIAFGMNADTPFCERCDTWADVHEGVSRLAIDGDDSSIQRLTDGELEALGDFTRTKKSTMPHLRLDLANCSTCKDTNYLSIVVVSEKVNDKGETSTSEDSLLTNLTISPEQILLVRDAGSAPAAVEDAASESGAIS